jgi:hypothetical protein
MLSLSKQMKYSEQLSRLGAKKKSKTPQQGLPAGGGAVVVLASSQLTFSGVSHR